MNTINGNAAIWFVDRHLDEGRADKPAFREAWQGGRELSYAALSQQTCLVAGAFSNANINSGERAALFMLDQLEFPLVFWGALKAGVVPIALNTLLSTDVYRRILQDSQASIAFVSEELLETVLPAVKSSEFIRHTVVVGAQAPESTTPWHEFMQDAKELKALACSADDVAFWLYSSGSTGAPKGVRHVHAALRVTCDTYANQVLNIQTTDTVFSVAKLFFAYGLGNGMSFPLSVGATSLLFNARPTPDAVSEILAIYKPTIFYGVPTLYAALVHQWESGGTKPEAPLRTCVSAGEALPAEIGRKWQALWSVDILDGVGSTEMLHIFLSNQSQDVQYGTSGQAVPGYDLRLVDEQGQNVNTGEIGELLVRGGSSALDYWNQADKTRTTFEGQWTRTGDKYELNASGRYIYCGRTDDMFKVSGIWVSPFEIEQALVEHPAVLEAAVVARRDDDQLEKPSAFVVLKEAQNPETADELKEFVKNKVGLWKYPRWVDIVDELPKTATGKIQRFKLRESV